MAYSPSGKRAVGSMRLILRGLIHYRRAHLGLLAGTVLAGAILTGAMIVGDSVDHTLRTFALQRLGAAALAITPGDRLINDRLGPALSQELGAPVATVLALPGMAIHQDAETGERAQVNKVQALGVDASFWALGEGGGPVLGRREAALNARLAEALGVGSGDTVALRIAKPGLLSRDAPLSSREEDPSERANFKVKAVVSDAQMGRFGLAANQIPPSNFFVALEDLQQLADCPDRANLLLAAAPATQAAAEAALEKTWTPADAGIKAVAREGGVLQVESERIFLDAPTAAAAMRLPGAQGAMTYLVNTLESGGKSTPYSFMTAADTRTADLRDDEAVINAWLAEQLGIGEGATLTIRYFEVLPNNKFVEQSREFKVKRVLSVEEFALEKALVPEFPGLSNVESCKDWKIGMPMDEERLKDPANEAYWKQYRATPKALITLAAGQAMWANRFGDLTAVRFPQDGQTAEGLLAALGQELRPRDAGLEVRAIREAAEQAVAQAMDLGGLFLGMSFFLLIAALVLTGLLYAFGVQQRATETGVLTALGFTRARVRRLLLAEASAVALPGAALGAALGLFYAWALIFALANYWGDAVGQIPILFAASPVSLATGILATLVCALLAAALTVRRLLQHSVNELIHADFTQSFDGATPARWPMISAALCAVLAAGLVAHALRNPSPTAAGTFFGAGFLALAAGLLGARAWLSRPAVSAILTLARLARLNTARRRGRSLGMLASLSAGTFLVLAVASMQTDLASNARDRSTGTGGFQLYVESTVPLLDPAEANTVAQGVHATGMRVFEGDDASCLNLNHAVRPRVLGVDAAEMARLGAFTPEGAQALWALLDHDLGNGVIPALVGDSDTAMWTLKKSTGVENGDEIIYRDEAGRDVRVRLVGKLPMRLSVLSGTVLVSSANFTRLWPSTEGFRAFLVDTPEGAEASVAAALGQKFDRSGLDITTTLTRLEAYHSVEATYLNMFLVLGGLGMLLGALATGIVVLRNLLERRREIALLRAVGFAPARVYQLLASEFGGLLLLGAAIGGAASLIAMLPALAASHGGASSLWRLSVLAGVFGSAAACAFAALFAALRKTTPANLRAE